MKPLIVITPIDQQHSFNYQEQERQSFEREYELRKAWPVWCRDYRAQPPAPRDQQLYSLEIYRQVVDFIACLVMGGALDRLAGRLYQGEPCGVWLPGEGLGTLKADDLFALACTPEATAGRRAVGDACRARNWPTGMSRANGFNVVEPALGTLYSFISSMSRHDFTLNRDKIVRLGVKFEESAKAARRKQVELPAEAMAAARRLFDLAQGYSYLYLVY